jgi:hypothetical protein
MNRKARLAIPAGELRVVFTGSLLILRLLQHPDARRRRHQVQAAATPVSTMYYDESPAMGVTDTFFDVGRGRELTGEAGSSHWQAVCSGL